MHARTAAFLPLLTRQCGNQAYQARRLVKMPRNSVSDFNSASQGWCGLDSSVWGGVGTRSLHFFRTVLWAQLLKCMEEKKL